MEKGKQEIVSESKKLKRTGDKIDKVHSKNDNEEKSHIAKRADTGNEQNEAHGRHHSKHDTSSTIADHSGKSSSDQACIVYKFQSRPPYEGFILILVIVVVAILLLWWLNGKLKASEQ